MFNSFTEGVARSVPPLTRRYGYGWPYTVEGMTQRGSNGGSSGSRSSAGGRGPDTLGRIVIARSGSVVAMLEHKAAPRPLRAIADLLT